MDTAVKKKFDVKFIIIAAAIVILAVVVDQLTKLLFKNWLTNPSKSVHVLGNWLMFEFTLNTGASFGMFDGKSVLFFIITLIGIPLFCFIAWVTKKDSLLGAYGVAVVVGGIIGNAIDRAFLGDAFFNGGVRDFVAVRGFAIFNFADACMTVGIAIYIIGILFVGKNPMIKLKGKKTDSE